MRAGRSMRPDRNAVFADKMAQHYRRCFASNVLDDIVHRVKPAGQYGM
ncbi:hypothetical protein [Bifidobacterium callitrichos]|nr:hypothetical protein [Bifidobacterium callitrichos]